MSLFPTVEMWVDVQLSTGGVATFYPTSDGTAGGAALFSSIAATQVTAEANTSTLSAIPVASLKAVSGDRKMVTVNVVTGTVLGVLGATTVAAPDGTKVHALIMGQR